MVTAERENITPGLDATLTERLKPGTYAITCGLLSNPRGTLTVTATAESEAAKVAPEIRVFIGPLSEYRVYLDRRAAALIDATAALSERIAAGDLDGAKAAWLAARQPWRQMAPVSGRVDDLVKRSIRSPTISRGASRTRPSPASTVSSTGCGRRGAPRSSGRRWRSSRPTRGR